MQKQWDIKVYFFPIFFKFIAFEIPGTNNYPPICTKKPLRSGAEEEYDIRGELGMVLAKPKQKGYLDFFIQAPSSFEKPFGVACYTFIRPHKSLKIYR